MRDISSRSEGWGIVLTPRSNKRHALPLRVRLFGYLALFCVFVILILWVLQVALLGNFYRSMTLRRLRGDVRDISASIDLGDDLDIAVYDAAQDSGVCASVYKIKDGRGSTAASAHVKNNCFIHTFLSSDDLARIYSDTKNAGGTLVTGLIGDTENSDGGESMIYSVILDGDGAEYLMLFNTESYPVGATAAMITVQLSLITVLLLLGAAVLAVVISKNITHPVASLSSEAKRLAVGDYDVNFSGSGISEIQNLGDTLKYAASELSKNDRRQKERIANISHDLRTPLTLISGYSEVMRDIPDERTPENMQVVIDESARLSGLVNDILDATKLESGTEQLSTERFSLTDEVEAECRRYSEMLRAKGYTVTYERDGGDAFVMGDKRRVMQAVCNLVNNALNFTGEDKTVHVRQITADGICRTEVIDTGEGISKEDAELIWDRYYRARDRKTKGVPGTGLGLSIVRQVMELHGARYGVTSVPGHGSTFWFEMTLA